MNITQDLINKMHCNKEDIDAKINDFSQERVDKITRVETTF